MKFSAPAFIAPMLLVIASAIVCILEGTFTSKRVTMGFVNHGGMWGDLLILPIIAGLSYPYFVRSRLVILPALLAAIVFTGVAHFLWAKSLQGDGVTEHIFGIHPTGIWCTDMSIAGWMHFIVMSIFLAITFTYCFSPMPINVVFIASVLLTVHVFLGTVQPGWYCTGKLWTWKNFATPVLCAVLIWTVALIKIRLSLS